LCWNIWKSNTVFRFNNYKKGTVSSALFNFRIETLNGYVLFFLAMQNRYPIYLKPSNR
jgi:hypothetical protein